MIRRSSDHALLSWVYRNYKSLLAVETDEILMATENIISFERLTQEFDTLFEYTFQEESKLKLPNINIIQCKHVIIIDQTDYIKKFLFRNIGEQKQKMR